MRPPSSSGSPRKRKRALRRHHPGPPARQAHPRAAPAGRRRRRDHAVEFPGRDDHAQGRARARGRLHGRRASPRPRRPTPRSRSPSSRSAPASPAGVIQRRHRPRARDRRRADRRCARAQALLHRLDRDRQAPDGAVREDDEEGLARTRRQCALHRVRRRGSRCRGRWARSPPSTATPARPASAPTGCSCRSGVYDAFAAKLVADGAEASRRRRPCRRDRPGPADRRDRARQGRGAHRRCDSRRARRSPTGGHRHALGGTFFEPTVLTGVTPAMMVAREETFGPVAPLFRFKTEAEAIAMANDTEFGLAAYLYTRDLARSWRVSEALEYGIVGLNTGTHLDRGRAFRRRQGVGHGPRRLEVRDPRLHRDQVRLRRRSLLTPRPRPALQFNDSRNPGRFMPGPSRIGVLHRQFFVTASIMSTRRP